jgi:hypothetical protein
VNIEVIKFERLHLEFVMMLPPTAPEIVNLSLYDLLGRTALIDGEPVASMGVMQQWKGVGEAWTISKPMRDNERRAIALRLRRGLDGFMKEEGLHRIQATVRADLPTPNHLARLMGMELEGVSIAYDMDKNDYNRYAKVI